MSETDIASRLNKTISIRFVIHVVVVMWLNVATAVMASVRNTLIVMTAESVVAAVVRPLVLVIMILVMILIGHRICEGADGHQSQNNDQLRERAYQKRAIMICI